VCDPNWKLFCKEISQMMKRVGEKKLVRKFSQTKIQFFFYISFFNQGLDPMNLSDKLSKKFRQMSLKIRQRWARRYFGSFGHYSL